MKFTKLANIESIPSPEEADGNVLIGILDNIELITARTVDFLCEKTEATRLIIFAESWRWMRWWTYWRIKRFALLVEHAMNEADDRPAHYDFYMIVVSRDQFRYICDRVEK